MDRPPFADSQRAYKSLDFTEGELDEIYDRLDAALKAQVDAAVTEALGRQGYENVRPGSPRWVTTRRVALRSLLCEAEDREADSESGP